MEEEVTAAQAAQLTGLSERTIRRRIATQQIPARLVARNRYAIRVSDLPIRRPTDEVMARLQALEYRMRVLELQVTRLLAQLEPAPAVADAGLEEQPDVENEPATEVGDLLAQLAHEVRRLAPLLSAGSPPARRRSRGPRTPASGESAESDHAAQG